MNLCSKTGGSWTVGSAQADQPSGGRGRRERGSLSRWPCLLHLARGDISAVAGRAGFDPLRTRAGGKFRTAASPD